MALSTTLKSVINRLLSPVNLQLSTKTEENVDKQRIANLKQQGYFDRPAFPLPNSIEKCHWQTVVECVNHYRTDLEKFARKETNQVGFYNNNGFFSPPDSDVLYSIIRNYKPKLFLEIGCGNSTRLVRQAIIDGNLSSHIVSIDPSPRIDISGFADKVHMCPVEHFSPTELSEMLEPGDVLFIDSSHISSIGSDCTYEFLRLIPALKSGVLVHVHDVSLPWDYPKNWFEREPIVLNWNEQYLLQALLMSNTDLQVLWPGYYVQKTQPPVFLKSFPKRPDRDATSFWFIV